MASRLKPFIYRWLKELASYTPLERQFFYRYEYMFTPPQLCFLCAALDDVREVPGAIVEIGCAFGHTTVFLNRHLDARGIEKPYWCIDTFRGFPADDVAAEQRLRGGRTGDLRTFRHNSPRWFRRTLANNRIERVRTLVADVKTVDFAPIAPIAFCLIDVDLYQPVLVALERVWERLAPGGMVVIDDCREGHVFEGALHAYREFLDRTGAAPEIRLDKLGILRKP